MNTDIFSLILGAVLLIEGLATLVTKKHYTMGRSADKYTEESLKKFIVPAGIVNVLMGLGILGQYVINDVMKVETTFAGLKLGWWVSIGAIVIGLILYFAIGKKILVKKDKA